MLRILIAIGLLLCASAECQAQPVQGLPESPAYKGDIRRTPDGKLIAVEERQAGASTEATRLTTFAVGPGEKIRSITEAAKVARNGDVIDILPGEYRGQPAIWTQDDLVIRGKGARPILLAEGKSAEGKGLWVIRGGNVRVENLEFRGVRVASGNGAGIRFEKGHLVIHRCAFIDNEMGILTGNSSELTLEVSDSEFADAPRHEGDLHHLLYVGQIGRFRLTGSRFTNGYRGHLVKSRARENHVLYNMLADGAEGRASYELEFPNGGIAFVIGNIIAQNADTENPTLVSYGAEGPHWPDNALYFAHNTLVNDRYGGIFLKLWTEKLPGNFETWIINNLTVGNGDLFPPPRGRFEGNLSAQRGDLIAYTGLPLLLKADSPLRGQVRIPGTARDSDLLPKAEFTLPAGQRPISPGSALAPGAFQ
ncbi:MAG: hypothetical protein QMB52_13390 [Propionivibrio sp.]